MRFFVSMLFVFVSAQVFAEDEHASKYIKGSPMKGETIVKKGETVGEFDSIDWGDMPHVNFILSGKKKSYFAHKGPWEVLEKNQKELKGTKIKLSWERVRTYISYAGSNMEITQTSDICAFSKIPHEVHGKKIAVCK